MNPFDDLIPRAPSGASGLFDDLLPQPSPEPVSPTMSAPTTSPMPMARPVAEPIAPDRVQSPIPGLMGLFRQFATDDYQPDIPFDPMAMPGVDQATQPFQEFGMTTGAPLGEVMMPPDAVPAGPFDDEPLSALLSRRGQQFVSGAANLSALIPEGISVTAARQNQAQIDSAPPRVADWMAQREALAAQLEAGVSSSGQPLAPEDLVIIQERIAGLDEGITAWSSMQAAPASEGLGFQIGESIRNLATETVGDPDPRDESFWGQVATGLGSTVPFIAAAPFGPAAPIIGAGMGAAANVGGQYDEAIQSGATEETAQATAGPAALVGMFEAVPVLRAIRFLPDALQGQVTNRIAQEVQHVAQSGGEEAVQESLANIGNNLIAQGYYDPERGWNEGLLQDALVGGTVGSLIGGGGVAARRARDAVTPAEPEPEQQIADLFRQLSEAGVPDAADVAQGSASTGIAPYVPGEARTAPEAAQQPQVEPEAPVTTPAQEATPVAPVESPFADLTPEEPVATQPAPTEQAPAQPVDDARPQAPETVQEMAPDVPELRFQQPLTATLRRLGGIQATETVRGETRPTWLATELRARGITPQTHPRLFNNRTGMARLDNIDPDSLSNEARQILPMEGRFVSEQALIDAIEQELGQGRPFYMSIEARNAMEDFQRAQRDVARSIESDTPALPAPGDTASPYQVTQADFVNYEDGRATVEAMVDRAVGDLGITITPAERGAVVDRISRQEQGDVVDALMDEMIRSVQAGIWQPEGGTTDAGLQAVPFDDAGSEGRSDTARGERDTGQPRSDRGTEGRGEPDTGEPRRAEASTEQTPTQQIVSIPDRISALKSESDSLDASEADMRDRSKESGNEFAYIKTPEYKALRDRREQIRNERYMLQAARDEPEMSAATISKDGVGVQADDKVPTWLSSFVSELFSATKAPGGLRIRWSDRPLVNGEEVIAFMSISKGEMTVGPKAVRAGRIRALEIIAHEFGHYAQYTMFRALPEADKLRIYQDYFEWKSRIERKGGNTFRSERHPVRIQKNVMRQVQNLGRTAGFPSPYDSSFKEWFADMSARALTTSDRSLSFVDKFFGRIAAVWKKIVGKLREEGYTAQSVADFYASREPSIDITPEGEQTVIPGAEARPDGEGTRAAARTRAEDEARVRQQQSRMRTGTPQEAPGGLFGDDQQSLLDAPTRVGRRPKGGLSPTFLDFSFTSRPSVFDHAFRAAGLDPKAAVNMPIEEQFSAVQKAVESTFGIKVEVPTKTVRRKNRFGRMVAEQRTDLSIRKATDQLLNAYRNLQMLAHIMSLPEKAIGLPINGNTLTLSLVSRGKLRGALGMYAYTGNGANRTIYLPDMSNSFAHEWAHALDHYMALQSDAPMLKGLITRAMSIQGHIPRMTPKRHLTDAFAHIIWSMYGDGAQIGALRLQLQVESAQLGPDGQPTPKANRARKILTDMREGRLPPDEYRSTYFKSSKIFSDMNGDNGYFTDPAEMFARAFEAMVGNQVAAISDLPQAFLSKGDWAYSDSQDTRAALTFPRGIDMVQFSVAMSNLQQAMSRISLFGTSAPAEAPASHDTLGTRDLLKQPPQSATDGVISREMLAAMQNIAAMRNAPAALTDLKASFSEKIGEIHSQAIRTGAATLYAIAARQSNPKARESLTNIAKAVGKQPGKGRLTESLWEENVRRIHGVRVNKVDGAVRKALRAMKVRQLSQSHLSQLRYELSGQPVSKANPAIAQLATDLRQILNEVWYDLQSQGIEVGYASNYLPHIYDADIAAREPEKFRRQAKQVYDLLFQREVTDNTDTESQMRDVNAIINGLRGATDAMPSGDRAPAPRLSETDESVITAFRDARKKLRDLERRQERSDDPDQYTDRIQDQADTVETLQAEMLDMLKDRWSEYSAEKWSIAQRTGELNDFGSIGPTANFLKGRTLPNEAGIIMQDFMHRNPVELIMNYSMSAAKRSEYAKIFGADNSKLRNMLDAAEGATKSDIDMMKMGVNAATGRMMPSGSGWQNFKTTTFVFGNLSLLPMATFSSLAEPLTAGLRSGQTRDGLAAIGHVLANLIRRGKRQELLELARTIGLILPYAQDSLMQNRLGMDVLNNRAKLQGIVQNFFVINGLTPLTHYQRAMNLPVANAVILRHLRSAVRGKRGVYGWVRDSIAGKEGAFASGELNELGISEAHRKEMLDWLESIDGMMPSPDDLFGPDGQTMHRAGELWARATYRFSTETVQDPLKTDRTMMANHPDHAAMYGIMSFIDGFTRNVLWRNLERGINEGDGFWKKTGKGSANAALMMMPMGTLIAGQVLVGIVREAISNMDKMRELEDDEDELALAEWLIERGLFRSGVFGRLDPLMNLVSGVRYETDLASMFAGPYAAHFFRQAQTIIAAEVGRNSRNTNTAEFNAAVAMYRLAVQPAVTTAASMVNWGPISINAARGGLLYLTSRNAANDFSEGLVGEKGSQHVGDPPWWERGGPSDNSSVITRSVIRPILEAIRAR